MSWRKAISTRLGSPRGGWLRPGRQAHTAGATAALRKRFGDEDVLLYARLTGDDNPLHLDPQYAATTHYGQCIVHGTLINGLASAVFGTRLPGPGAVFLSQEIRFPSPLFIGEEVEAKVQVLQLIKRLMTCSINCTALKRNKIVMTGEVKLLLPRSSDSNRK